MTLLSILSKTELNKFNATPIFTIEQKKYTFDILFDILDKIHTFTNDYNKTIFILLYGYFKTSNKFFGIDILFNDDSNSDYVYKNFDFKKDGSSKISYRTIQNYQKIIKDHFCMNNYTKEIQEVLETEAINLANNFVHSKKIFYSLVEMSKKLKIEIPSYTELCRIITISINSQKKSILNKLILFNSDNRLNELDEFLEKNENHKSRYNIMNYKNLNTVHLEVK